MKEHTASAFFSPQGLDLRNYRYHCLLKYVWSLKDKNTEFTKEQAVIVSLEDSSAPRHDKHHKEVQYSWQITRKPQRHEETRSGRSTKRQLQRSPLNVNAKTTSSAVTYHAANAVTRILDSSDSLIMIILLFLCVCVFSLMAIPIHEQ